MSPEPVPIRRVFRHQGIALCVAAEPDDITWLEEFLGPALVEDPDAVAGACISFGPGAEVRAQPRGEPIVAFALDSGPLLLAPSPVGAGAARFTSPWRRATMTVGDAGRSTRVAYASDRLSGRVYWMRVVREYAHNHAVRTGGLVLHAAGVMMEDLAIGIAGAKSSGKTTLLLRALQNRGTAFLANDRLLVRPGSPPRAIGVASVASVRPGTRELFPGIAEILRSAGDFRRTVAERAAIGPEQTDSYGDDWLLSPAQLSAAVDRPMGGPVSLSALLFLGGDRSHPRRLGDGEAGEAIARCLLGRGGSTLASDLFFATPGEPPSEAVIQATCRALAEQVTCVACPPDVDLGGLLASLRAWQR